MKNFLLVFLFIIWGCNTAPKTLTPAEDTSFSEPTSGLETIAILGSNDIHGTLAPQVLMTHENSGTPSVQYETAGGAVIASYVKILRKEFGDRLIWLDAGDEFQGSIESNLDKGSPVVDLLNAAGLNAAAIGNHEFDFGLDSLKRRMTEAHYPYLAANVVEKKTGKLANFPNTYPHWIFNVGKLRVGVIGLSTLDTPKTTLKENVKTLEFEDLKETTLRESMILRKMGARIVLLTSHVGAFCGMGHMSPGRTIRKPMDPQGECNDHDELVQLLQSLPANTVDGVVAGHTHQIIHHWIAGVPVVQGGVFGRYLNVIYLTFDWAKKQLLTDQTRIEGPVPVCAQVFQNQNDCNGDRPSPKNGRGPLVPVKFHGEMVQPDPEITRLLEPILKKSSLEKNRVLGIAARPIEHIRSGESPLGNLLADSVRQASGADVALVNSGGIRAPLEKGPVTYGAIFRSIPFENRISTLKVTGQELKLILRVAESGSRGFPPVSGVKLRLIDPASEAPSSDLDGTGKDDPWKVNRLIEATLSDGRTIDPEKFYTLATLDFLVTGGDDLAWPMSQIPADRIRLNSGIPVRDALITFIQNAGPLNSENSPLVDPSHPRLQFEKPPARKATEKNEASKSKRKGKKRRHRQPA